MDLFFYKAKITVLTWVTLTVTGALLITLNINPEFIVLVSLIAFSSSYYFFFVKNDFNIIKMLLNESIDPKSRNRVAMVTTTLYIGNLGDTMSEKLLKKNIGKICKVKSVRIMKDRNTGKSKGYGFVEIAAYDIENAIEQLQHLEIEEHRLIFQRKNSAGSH
tara:strand:- start:18261 stop:18746 length:486 start_codon:yes stop_codon:yes gene_type:complete